MQSVLKLHRKETVVAEVVKNISKLKNEFQVNSSALKFVNQIKSRYMMDNKTLTPQGLTFIQKLKVFTVFL